MKIWQDKKNVFYVLILTVYCFWQIQDEILIMKKVEVRGRRVIFCLHFIPKPITLFASLSKTEILGLYLCVHVHELTLPLKDQPANVGIHQALNAATFYPTIRICKLGAGTRNSAWHAVACFTTKWLSGMCCRRSLALISDLWCEVCTKS